MHTFSSREVCAAAGISYRQLIYWMERSLCEPEHRRVQTQGNPLRWHESELHVLIDVGRLRALGFGVEQSFEIARAAQAGCVDVDVLVGALAVA